MSSYLLSIGFLGGVCVYIYTFRSISVSTYLFMYILSYLLTYLTYLSTSVCLSIHPSVYLPACLSPEGGSLENQG